MKFVHNQKQIFIDAIMLEELTKVKKRVLTKDLDWLAVIDGEEGVGKSVLAQQLASFLDPDFNLSKIVFNANDFMNLIKSKTIKKGSAVVLDEAFSAANSRASLTEVNRAMIGVATEMRQQNLFIIMVLPTFFDLDKYFALWRCRALFHVYFTNNYDRRYIAFPKNAKKLLYLNGKKKYSYAKPRSPFPPCQFFNTYTVDELEYRKKKAEAFQKRVVSYRAQQWLAQRNAYIKHIIKNEGITGTDAGKIPAQYGAPSLTSWTIGSILKQLEVDK